jgi:hypothetical protein
MFRAATTWESNLKRRTSSAGSIKDDHLAVATDLQCDNKSERRCVVLDPFGESASEIERFTAGSS